MRVLRTTMLVATLATLALGAQLAACGGDDEAPAAPSPPDAGDASSTGPTLTVSSSRAKLYLGQSVKIEGATIAPEVTSKFVWSVVAAPSASGMTTASIQDATTVSPSFKPDRLGLYTLQLSGEKADGAAASVLVILEAIDAPVFFRDLHLTSDSAGGSMTLAATTQVAGAYGSPARTVGCALTTATDGGSPGSDLEIALVSARASAVNGDTWEAPPGTPSRVVFAEFQGGQASATITSRLGVATSTSECGAAEAKILDTRSSDAGAGPNPPNFIFNTRFSPDGNRIAYINDLNGSARLTTIGFDGADKHDLTPVTAVGDGGLNGDAGSTIVSGGGGGSPSVFGPISPRWQDSSHVGWVSFVGPDAATAARSSWELWVVEDKAGASAELVMRCAGSGLTHFDFLPDGAIVASARHVVSTDAGNIAPMDLLVYRANPSTKACEIVRNLTKHTSEGAVARDFALSPDKSTIAFFAGLALDPSGGNPISNVTQLFTAPVDGSRAAAPVPGVSAPGDFGVGPRWAAGGTVISWGQAELSGPLGGGGGSPIPASRLMAVPIGGGDTVQIADISTGVTPSSDGGLNIDYHIRYGMGQGCSAAPGGFSNGFMLVVGALGVVGLVARRRRSSAR